MTPDAIQILVRGFQTQELGEAIVAALNEIGFEIKSCCGNSSDDLGGIIETYLTNTIELSPHSVDEIRKTIYALTTDPILIQYRSFVEADQ